MFLVLNAGTNIISTVLLWRSYSVADLLSPDDISWLFGAGGARLRGIIVVAELLWQ